MSWQHPDPDGLAMPLGDALEALRNLPPGTELLEPVGKLRTLAETLRAIPAGEDAIDWLRAHAAESMVTSLLWRQLSALDRAISGYNAAADADQTLSPERNRLLQAARSVSAGWSEDRTEADGVSLLDYLADQVEFRNAAMEWAENTNLPLLYHALRSAPGVDASSLSSYLTDEQVQQNALRALATRVPSPAENETESSFYRQTASVADETFGARVRLDTVAVADWGFSIIAVADTPKNSQREGSVVITDLLSWNGLTSIVDDRGYRYVIRQRNHRQIGDQRGRVSEVVTHWCFPALDPSVTSLSCTSDGWQVEHVSFDKRSGARPERSITKLQSDLLMRAELQNK